nr:immunoglobulin heavy chain junction region [Macaca mulatta]MOY24034.1 immunoglobulin heavy chain junction region [Macaca mulatta]MOY24901.1 immunoglobulin heavy chain junction region [Macaca mulatta]MOY28434.1 immunoglobulin heavy chain junction region [Macaca mulatta]MOY30538.1 immunoglobulin heavy chain junction region [Macaca mulatta]
CARDRGKISYGYWCFDLW